jgi:peptidoglycan/xylan/chitin deacetylase (PgdA/CDA1 family)
VVSVLVLTGATGWWRFAGDGPFRATAANAAAPSSSEEPGRGNAGGRAHRRVGETASLALPAGAAVSPEDAAAAVQRFVDLGYPIYCGGGNAPVVALTFDDGPGPYTPDTLDALRDRGARATFFMAGIKLQDQWVDLRDVLDVGVIGDHTWNHINLAGASEDTLVAEIDQTRAALEQGSHGSVALFRPPYGSHDDGVDAHVRGLGMLQVLWTLDSGDSAAGATPEKEMATLRHEIGPGQIVLLHENRGPTHTNLSLILDLVQEEGLQAVTVPELLAMDPPSMRQLRSGTCS